MKCSAAGLGKQPLVSSAKSIKGRGISFVEDKEGWHGKALSKDEAAKAIAELEPKARTGLAEPIPAPSNLPLPARLSAQAISAEL